MEIVLYDRVYENELHDRVSDKLLKRCRQNVIDAFTHQISIDQLLLPFGIESGFLLYLLLALYNFVFPVDQSDEGSP